MYVVIFLKIVCANKCQALGFMLQSNKLFSKIEKFDLKVLSSEMDLAESMFIRKVFIKREARRFLEKSARPPSCESLWKPQRHPVQLLAI